MQNASPAGVPEKGTNSCAMERIASRRPDVRFLEGVRVLYFEGEPKESHPFRRSCLSYTLIPNTAKGVCLPPNISCAAEFEHQIVGLTENMCTEPQKEARRGIVSSSLEKIRSPHTFALHLAILIVGGSPRTMVRQTSAMMFSKLSAGVPLLRAPVLIPSR